MESSIEPKEHEREAEEEEEEGCRTELDLHISDSIYGNKVSISCVDPQEGGVLFDDTDLPVGTSMVICPEVDFTKHPIFMRHIFERVGRSQLACGVLVVLKELPEDHQVSDEDAHQEERDPNDHRGAVHLL